MSNEVARSRKAGSLYPRHVSPPCQEEKQVKENVTRPGHSVVFSFSLHSQHTRILWSMPTFILESFTLPLDVGNKVDLVGTACKHFFFLLRHWNVWVILDYFLEVVSMYMKSSLQLRHLESHFTHFELPDRGMKPYFLVFILAILQHEGQPDYAVQPCLKCEPSFLVPCPRAHGT